MNNREIGGPTAWKDPEMLKRIEKRYAKERRFRLLGLGAIGIAIAFLFLLLGSITYQGAGGFTQAELALDIQFDAVPLLRRLKDVYSETELALSHLRARQ